MAFRALLFLVAFPLIMAGCGDTQETPPDKKSGLEPLGDAESVAPPPDVAALPSGDTNAPNTPLAGPEDAATGALGVVTFFDEPVPLPDPPTGPFANLSTSDALVDAALSACLPATSGDRLPLASVLAAGGSVDAVVLNGRASLVSSPGQTKVFPTRDGLIVVGRIEGRDNACQLLAPTEAPEQISQDLRQALSVVSPPFGKTGKTETQNGGVRWTRLRSSDDVYVDILVGPSLGRGTLPTLQVIIG
ncbi:MAG: hypothetical protein AAFQ67_03865 [Pseudomonadota bacterium]